MNLLRCPFCGEIPRQNKYAVVHICPVVGNIICGGVNSKDITKRWNTRVNSTYTTEVGIPKDQPNPPPYGSQNEPGNL